MRYVTLYKIENNKFGYRNIDNIIQEFRGRTHYILPKNRTDIILGTSYCLVKPLGILPGIK